MAILELLGARIKTLREAKNLTQEELAEKAGIESPSYVSKMERGLSAPSYEMLGFLADALGVELRDFFDIKLKKAGKVPVKPFDKWMLKYRSLLKGCRESELKTGYYILKKLFS